MSQQKRRYTPEFKVEAVRMVLDQGHSVVEVAKRLGIPSTCLYEWKQKYETKGDQAFPGEGAAKSEDMEVRELRRELERVRQERDILKKALAYFANEKK